MSYETLKHYCSIVAAVYQNVTFLSWACPSPQCCGTCCEEMTLPPTEGPSGRKSTAVCCLFSMQYLSKIRNHKVCFVSLYFKSLALHNFFIIFISSSSSRCSHSNNGRIFVYSRITGFNCYFMHCMLLTAAKAAHPKLDYTINWKVFTNGIMHIYENIKHQ